MGFPVSLPTAVASSLRHWATRALALLSLCWMASGCDGGDRVRLGVAMRAELLDAARLALFDELAEGAIPRFDTLLIVEDAIDPGAAIIAAGRFAAAGNVIGVVGHMNSPASLAASQVYNLHGIVQMSPTTTADLYSDAGPYSFRIAPTNRGQGRFLAETLRERFPDGATLALLYVNDDYGRDLRAAFLEHLDDGSFDVVVELPHTERAPADGFAHERDAILARSPDVLVWLARSRRLDALMRNLVDAGIRLPVFAGDASSLAVQFDNLDGRWDDTWLVEMFDMSGGGDALDAFRSRYLERFGREASVADVLTYDATRLLVSGIRAGARTGDDLVAYLLALGRDQPPFPGLSGGIAFTDKGDVEHPTFGLGRVHPRESAP